MYFKYIYRKPTNAITWNKEIYTLRIVQLQITCRLKNEEWKKCFLFLFFKFANQLRWANRWHSLYKWKRSTQVNGRGHKQVLPPRDANPPICFTVWTHLLNNFIDNNRNLYVSFKAMYIGPQYLIQGLCFLDAWFTYHFPCFEFLKFQLNLTFRNTVNKDHFEIPEFWNPPRVSK